MRNPIQHHNASKIIPITSNSEMSAQAPLACVFMGLAILARSFIRGVRNSCAILITKQ